MEPNGYTADVERTDDASSRAGTTRPASARAQPIDDYGQGVVTPHAAFLALDFDSRRDAGQPGARSQADFPGLYGRAASRTR